MLNSEPNESRDSTACMLENVTGSVCVHVCGQGTALCQHPRSSGCVVRAFVLLPSHQHAYVTEAPHSYSPPEFKKPTFANAESC